MALVSESQNVGVKYEIVRFESSQNGCAAFIRTRGSKKVWSQLLTRLALDDQFISGLSPSDAFQVGFWLGHEVTS